MEALTQFQLELTRLNALYEAQILLILMIKNASESQSQQNFLWITVANTSLYKIAEQYYGDATRWNEIAKLNGLTDPEIRQATTLRLIQVKT